MNPAEFLGSLALLGMSQTDAAMFFKVNDRTVRRWIAKEPPEAVAAALRFALTLKGIASSEPNGNWAQDVAREALCPLTLITSN